MYLSKVLKSKNVFLQFTIYLSTYTFFALLNLINFNQSYWWKYVRNENFYKSLFTLILILGFCYLFIRLYNLDEHKNKPNNLNIYITGLVVFLVVHPTRNYLFIPPLITYLALELKNVLRCNAKPIFNPAALGIFSVSAVSEILYLTFGFDRAFISWWGASFQDFTLKLFFLPINSLILELGFVYFAYRFKKHLYGFSFITSIIVSTLIYSYFFKIGLANSGLISAVTNFSRISTWLFLTFVMLVEPKTSPVFKNHQVALGMLGGIMYTLITRLKFIPSSEVLVILMLNAIYAFMFNCSKPKKVKSFLPGLLFFQQQSKTHLK